MFLFFEKFMSFIIFKDVKQSYEIQCNVSIKINLRGQIPVHSVKFSRLSSSWNSIIMGLFNRNIDDINGYIIYKSENK